MVCAPWLVERLMHVTADYTCVDTLYNASIVLVWHSTQPWAARSESIMTGSVNLTILYKYCNISHNN